MPDFEVSSLLDTGTVTVRNVLCPGTCRHRSAEECASVTHLVFPYRGTYLRHVGNDQAVADANHVLLFNADEGYRVSHPVPGGDASLVLVLAETALRELAPRTLLNERAEPGFDARSLRIDPPAQAMVALLRHGLQNGSIEDLGAESLALSLVGRSLGRRAPRRFGAMPAKRRLVDRIKLLLASEPGRRWTLAEIAREIGGSPVYLTQVFRQIEGLPLYRYQLHLRLARALDLIPDCESLAALAFDLGFSSHSHFSAAFKRTYGVSPSALQKSLS